MAYFSVMCCNKVLLFLLIMGVLIDVRDCKPYQSYQSTTTKSTYYSGGSNQPITKKPISSIANTIAPKTNPSTGPVLPSDGGYSLITAPRNCPEGHGYDHNNVCVPQFFGKIDPNDIKNKNQQLSSTSTIRPSGARIQNTNRNVVNTRRH